jgi:pimeloyl-ACP methyl ester carboxylesterase
MASTDTVTTQRVTSADGTRITYDLLGEGPPLVVVGGLLCDRRRTGPVARALAAFATVINIDRRGRGDSGDIAPYSVDREIEDLAAVIDANGGRAAVYGHSSGAGLALRAAAHGLPLTHLVLHEPPYGGDDEESTGGARALAQQVVTAIADGRGADAIDVFMTAAGVPAEMVEGMRTDPRMLAMAHTMRYDIEVMGELERGGTIPRDTVQAVRVPTLVLAGGASPDFFRDTATRIAALLADGRYEVLDNEGHDARPELIARIVGAFIAA